MLQRHDTAGFPHLQNYVVPLTLLQQSMAAWQTLPSDHVHTITPALAAQLAIQAATARPESFSNVSLCMADPHTLARLTHGRLLHFAENC